MSGPNPKPPPPTAPAFVSEDAGPPTQSLPGHVVADIQRRLRGSMPEPPPVVPSPVAPVAKKVDLNRTVVMMTSPLAPHLPVAIAGSPPSTGTLPLPDRPRRPSDPPEENDPPAPSGLDSRTRRCATLGESNK